MSGRSAARVAAGLGALLGLAGCAALPWPSGFERGSSVFAAGELLDLRGSVHVHTRVSHDSHGGPGELIDAAHDAGIAFIALSEHPYRAQLDPANGVIEGVLLIPGWEVKSAGASILALGVEQRGQLPHDPVRLVGEIHQRGGLAFVAHLESSELSDPERYAAAAPDGIEIVNLHAAALEVGVRLALGELFLPAAWAMRPLLAAPTANLGRFASLPSVRALVGGVDAHAKFRVLGPLGGKLDRYRDVFRLVTTHVLARERSTAGVLDALRVGRSYVAFEGIAPVSHFGVSRTAEGYAVTAPDVARLELVCAGATAASQVAAEAVLRPPADAERCHVEAWQGDRLWVITSPLPDGGGAPGVLL
ncbi:MAG TPA: hypothetical protein VMR50_02160 [Myxococcota bacterium]|nr:hypothetical protein [Myxococcota bacterium]